MSDYPRKPGVQGDVSEPIGYALGIAKGLYDALGVDLVITSLQEGQHKIGSLHGRGQAVDIRVHDMSEVQKQSVVHSLVQNLYQYGYDILLEHSGQANEHIHIEYDPKGQRRLPDDKAAQAERRTPAVAPDNPRVNPNSQSAPQSPGQPAQQPPQPPQPTPNHPLQAETKKLLIYGTSILLLIIAFFGMKGKKL
jgi:hypothetical protein